MDDEYNRSLQLSVPSNFRNCKHTLHISKYMNINIHSDELMLMLSSDLTVHHLHFGENNLKL